MSEAPPAIIWLRRDLRIGDHAALAAAAARGGPVIPVFILDPVTEAGPGAAQKARLHAALESLGRALADAGAPLVLRRGAALDVLLSLAEETGARAIHWTRLTDGASLTRDREVKAALKARGFEAVSHDGFTLLDPWRVKTKTGEPYKVFTPFSRAFAAMDIPAPLSAPTLRGPETPAASDRLEDWRLEAGMGPAAAHLRARFSPGEGAAFSRLDAWLGESAASYADDRNRLDMEGATTGLSDYLALGEISPRQIWAVMDRAGGGRGVEAARRQLIWRDFAHMLLFHDPEMERENWRREWREFPWRGETEDAEAWRRGETGLDVVDAAMRELWATGRMHNRARMITASWLTKNLLVHWRIGEAHFRETLSDWDPANNAMGWQWVAGSGPDAAPFFRIFNPERQAQNFDPEGKYRRYWLSGEGAAAFLEMRPKSWGPVRRNEAPSPSAGREEALAHWRAMRHNEKS